MSETHREQDRACSLKQCLMGKRLYDNEMGNTTKLRLHIETRHRFRTCMLSDGDQRVLSLVAVPWGWKKKRGCERITGAHTNSSELGMSIENGSQLRSNQRSISMQ